MPTGRWRWVGQGKEEREKRKKSERMRGHVLINIKIVCRMSEVKGGEQMSFVEITQAFNLQRLQGKFSNSIKTYGNC